MADYGPPGGPYRGGPWRGHQPRDAYGQPGRRPARAEPIAASGGAPPPKQRRVSWVTVLAVVVPLLAIAGSATVIYLLNDADAPAGAASTNAAATAAATPSAPAEETVPQVGSSDARFVKKGECLRNEGEPTKPKLLIAPCVPKTYEVLARFDGATDGEADAKLKCGTVPGYTDWYYFKSELDVLDYVLCLKSR